jgi:hypothetical protein
MQQYSSLKGQYKLARRNAAGENPMNIRPVRAAQKNHQSFFIIETIKLYPRSIALAGCSNFGKCTHRDAAG